jgi:hypothetical protein
LAEYAPDSRFRDLDQTLGHRIGADGIRDNQRFRSGAVERPVHPGIAGSGTVRRVDDRGGKEAREHLAYVRPRRLPDREREPW